MGKVKKNRKTVVLSTSLNFTETLEYLNDYDELNEWRQSKGLAVEEEFEVLFDIPQKIIYRCGVSKDCPYRMYAVQDFDSGTYQLLEDSAVKHNHGERLSKAVNHSNAIEKLRKVKVEKPGPSTRNRLRRSKNIPVTGLVTANGYTDIFGRKWTFLDSVKNREAVEGYAKSKKITVTGKNKNAEKIYMSCALHYEVWTKCPYKMIAIKRPKGVFNLYSREEHNHDSGKSRVRSRTTSESSWASESLNRSSPSISNDSDLTCEVCESEGESGDDGDEEMDEGRDEKMEEEVVCEEEKHSDEVHRAESPTIDGGHPSELLKEIAAHFKTCTFLSIDEVRESLPRERKNSWKLVVPIRSFKQFEALRCSKQVTVYYRNGIFKCQKWGETQCPFQLLLTSDEDDVLRVWQRGSHNHPSATPIASKYCSETVEESITEKHGRKPIFLRKVEDEKAAKLYAKRNSLKCDSRDKNIFYMRCTEYWKRKCPYKVTATREPDGTFNVHSREEHNHLLDTEITLLDESNSTEQSARKEKEDEEMEERINKDERMKKEKGVAAIEHNHLLDTEEITLLDESNSTEQSVRKETEDDEMEERMTEEDERVEKEEESFVTIEVNVTENFTLFGVKEELNELANEYELIFKEDDGQLVFISLNPLPHGSLLAFEEVGDSIEVDEYVNMEIRESEVWPKGDKKQFLRAVRGKCHNFFVLDQAT